MSERDRVAPEDGPANQMFRMNSRTGSTDASDPQQYHHKYHSHQVPPKQQQPYGYRGMPPAYPRQQQRPPPPPHGQQYNPYSTPQQQQQHRGRSSIQSVVTSSFSIEDEREDVAGPRGLYYNRPPPLEDRHPAEPSSDNSPRDGGNNPPSFREAPPPPMFDARAPMNAKPSMPIRIPPSPGDGRAIIDSNNNNNIINSEASKVTPDGLKRSFWHHSRPTDTVVGGMMHPAFLPPKRAKIAPPRKSRDVVLTPRIPGDPSQEYGPPRSNSWAGPEVVDDPTQHRHYRPTHSFPAPPWQQQQQQQLPRQSASFGGYPEEQDHYAAARASWDEGVGRGAFRSVQGGGRMPSSSRAPPPPYGGGGALPHQGSFPPPRWGRTDSYDNTTWSSPPQQQHEWQQRDDVVDRRSYSREMSSWDDRERQVTFDAYNRGGGGYYASPNDAQYHHHHHHHHSKVTPNSTGGGEPRSILKRDSMDEHGGMHLMPPGREQSGPLLLLAQPEDRISLSETLCTIRENIEVFRATKADVEAPAPGRKHPVIVGQVGLRCIHCRHTTKSSDRVKRAVCYPSSIKRIYRTVIDMKLDHFAHCRFVPKALKDRLDELKAINTRSTGTTMQYFVRAAHKMGMEDGTSGVRLVDPTDETTTTSSSPSSPDRPQGGGEAGGSSPQSPKSPGDASKAANSSSMGSPMAASSCGGNNSATTSPLAASKQLLRTDSNGSDTSMTTSETSVAEVPTETFMGKITLALPEDKMALSPLRCFLRQNVYAFTATEEDIAVRTPTTFSVVVGQVGIGCVHCHSLPAKERSNRAVCFPFAINRIYQSVADIQRFHLGECKMVPAAVREKFQSLQSASSKGSKGLATRQYWVTSAKKIGLIDTQKGIRYGRDPLVPATQAVSLDILAQVASNVTTVDRPLVLPEDKPFIAEFLYCVMEQLQPCRFTEADRNKRRLKDVGCIGVECKHCAGQVESRKFFWSSVNAVESNFVSVHTHMMECKMIPPELKEQLSELKLLRKEQTGRLKTGSQKAFFQRVWKRLHGDANNQEQQQQQQQQQGADDMAVEQTPNETTEGSDTTSPHMEKVSADIEKMAVISV